MMSGRVADDLSAVVRAARAGDEAAFRSLYREVQPGLLRYLRGLVGTQDAEDIAAESWLQIARDLHSFRGEGAGFRGWAATIARHRAMDHLRYVQRRPVDVSADVMADLSAATTARGEDTADAAITAITTDAAIAFIATLPPDQAEAVLLRAVMGLDTHTAAKVMGKRAGAVRTATWRGLGTLRTRLDTREGDAGVTQARHGTPRTVR